MQKQNNCAIVCIKCACGVPMWCMCKAWLSTFGSKCVKHTTNDQNMIKMYNHGSPQSLVLIGVQNNTKMPFGHFIKHLICTYKTNMWAMWVYIVWVKIRCIKYDKIAKQNVSRVSRGKALLERHSRKPTVTICHDSSHSNHVLSTCFTSWEGFSWATRKNSFNLQFALSLHTLSHTQPLQWNPTYNTGYIRLNIITIKFGTELKSIKNSCKSQLYSSIIGEILDFCFDNLIYQYIHTYLHTHKQEPYMGDHEVL